MTPGVHTCRAPCAISRNIIKAGEGPTRETSVPHRDARRKGEGGKVLPLPQAPETSKPRVLRANIPSAGLRTGGGRHLPTPAVLQGLTESPPSLTVTVFKEDQQSAITSHPNSGLGVKLGDSDGGGRWEVRRTKPQDKDI